MSGAPTDPDRDPPPRPDAPHPLQETPWQIWLVIVVLVVEGVGNLLHIPSRPVAALWLGTKVLFVTGLVRRWRWVFGLYLVVAALHVSAYWRRAPLAALLNLITFVLISSSYQYFFPARSSSPPLP